MVKVVMAGGGTAGHVNPLLATAAQLRESGAEVVVLGTAAGLESDLVPAAGFPQSSKTSDLAAACAGSDHNGN